MLKQLIEFFARRREPEEQSTALRPLTDDEVKAVSGGGPRDTADEPAPKEGPKGGW
jgi:hypothetical protein